MTIIVKEAIWIELSRPWQNAQGTAGGIEGEGTSMIQFPRKYTGVRERKKRFYFRSDLELKQRPCASMGAKIEIQNKWHEQKADKDSNRSIQWPYSFYQWQRRVGEGSASALRRFYVWLCIYELPHSFTAPSLTSFTNKGTQAEPSEVKRQWQNKSLPFTERWKGQGTVESGNGCLSGVQRLPWSEQEYTHSREQRCRRVNSIQKIQMMKIKFRKDFGRWIEWPGN